jgi:hypothetical protein
MPESDLKALTLKTLRERRERLARELASLEQASEGQAVLTAREALTWRTRLAELEARIARYAHE